MFTSSSTRAPHHWVQSAVKIQYLISFAKYFIQIYTKQVGRSNGNRHLLSVFGPALGAVKPRQRAWWTNPWRSLHGPSSKALLNSSVVLLLQGRCRVSELVLDGKGGVTLQIIKTGQNNTLMLFKRLMFTVLLMMKIDHIHSTDVFHISVLFSRSFKIL